MRRKRFIQLCARSTTQRRARKPASHLIAWASSPRALICAVKPNSARIGCRYRSPWHLPRCRTVEQGVLCQDLRFALDQPDVVGTDSVDRSGVGLALDAQHRDRLGTFQRFHANRQERHKKVTDWAHQMISCRRAVVCGDDGWSSWRMAATPSWNCWMRVAVGPSGHHDHPVAPDAALYDPAPPRKKGAKGRPRLKGKRQPTLAARVRIRPPCGNLARWAGIVAARVRWNWPAGRRSGTTVVCRSCPPAGS